MPLNSALKSTLIAKFSRKVLKKCQLTSLIPQCTVSPWHQIPLLYGQKYRLPKTANCSENTAGQALLSLEALYIIVNYNNHFCAFQEQLQINLLQQTHLNSSSGGKSNLHALQQQQHQLMAQIQLTQQALMLGQNLDSTDHQFQIKTDININNIKKDRERHAYSGWGKLKNFKHFLTL